MLFALFLKFLNALRKEGIKKRENSLKMLKPPYANKFLKPHLISRLQANFNSGGGTRYDILVVAGPRGTMSLPSSLVEAAHGWGVTGMASECRVDKPRWIAAYIISIIPSEGNLK